MQEDVINSNASAPPGGKKKFRIPSIPGNWENFGLSILFHLLLPLLPLVLEYIQTNTIGIKSLVLAVSMYTIIVGVSSRSKLMFGATIIAGLIFAYLYGLISSQTNSILLFRASFISIGATFIFHASERYNRHVVDMSPYWDFN